MSWQVYIIIIIRGEWFICVRFQGDLSFACCWQGGRVAPVGTAQSNHDLQCWFRIRRDSTEYVTRILGSIKPG